MLVGQRPTIFGDGNQSRDFTYIENVINGILLAANAPEISGLTFNIATGKRIRVLDLVHQINEILGTQIQPIFDEPRPGDILHSLADISAAEDLLGYQPRIRFAEGLQQTVSWFAETVSS